MIATLRSVLVIPYSWQTSQFLANFHPFEVMPWLDHGIHAVSFLKLEAEEQARHGLQDQALQ
ncbi:MAG: hypothetical protein AAFY05_15110 [Pseudomonadota bacterium]